MRKCKDKLNLYNKGLSQKLLIKLKAQPFVIVFSVLGVAN